MSASSKKKLRKEQVAEQMTERQRQEQQEAKKLKVISTTFIVIMALILVTAITITTVKTVIRSGVFEKNTIAATVDGNKLSTVDLTYYYTDAINKQYNEWSESYGESMVSILQMMELDLTKALDTQMYDKEAGYTWADYFVDVAIENAQTDYALSAEAAKNGYTLTDEDKETIEGNISTATFYGMIYGYSDLDHYLQNSYCYGASEKTYRSYLERSQLAKSYLAHYTEELDYSADEIQAHDEANPNKYSSFTYDNYYLSYTDFRQGGTKNESGITEYTEEESNAARKAVKEAAEKIKNASTDTKSFDAAIADVYKDIKEDAASTKTVDSLYDGVNLKYAEWLADKDRKDGDIEIFPNTSTSTAEDGTKTEVTNGYYVVMYHSSTDNTEHMSDVRHLLVSFKGGTKDEDGQTVYSDAEKATAKTEAEELLNTWKENGATEDAFVKLVKDETDDTASAETGGLYENVYSGSNYVENFLNWCIDESRQAGDTDLVETEYGYHIMYYVGRSDLNYRQYMISEDLRADEVDKWQTGVVDAVTAVKEDISRLHTDIVLASAS